MGLDKENNPFKHSAGLAADKRPLSPDNWFERTAVACENLSDAVVRKRGWTNRAVKIASAKLAAAAVPASLFSVAGLLGTASTGTAIGSLSGAAFTSSALAWIGGSVAMGTVVVSTASVGGFLVAPFLVKPLSEKYLTGKARKPAELTSPEKELVDACSALALGLRQAGKEGASLNAKQAVVLRDSALRPLRSRATDVFWLANEWPVLQRRKFRSAYESLGQSWRFADQVANDVEPAVVGLGSALLLNLLSEGDHVFSDAEQDVMEAIRRSSRELSNANNEEIAAHVQGMTPEQLLGFKNNIKGIAHELRFARAENSNGDEYAVELFDATNHPGADIHLTNVLTGDVREFQLKATTYGAYVENHIERYSDIPVMTTTEVAQDGGWETTGIANETLERDVDSALSGLNSAVGPEVLDSMAFAGLVTLARNVNAILTSGPEQAAKRKKLVADGTQAGLVAGIAELLI